MTASTNASSDTTAHDPEPRELEWQLATSDLTGVRHWVMDHPMVDGWIIEPPQTIELRDTYYDTEDWRIYSAGLALRVRDAAGQPEATLKELRSARQGVADRRELTEPLTEPTLAALPGLTGPVGTRVQAMTGTHPLRPLFTVRTSRERYLVRREGSVDVGELALDQTAITDPAGAARTTLQRVEVEAKSADGEALADFVSVLRRNCALEPASDSKYQLGLRSMGLAPPVAHQIGASMRIDQLASAALRQHLSAWHSHEPGARLGEDPEELHDLRIAGRRLEAALSLFADDLPAGLARVRQAFKKRLRKLGAVRDLDVALLEFEKFAQTLDPSERQELDPVRLHFVTERSRAQASMIRMLDAGNTQRCLARLEAAAESGTAMRKPVRDAAVVVIPALLRSRYKKLRKAIRRLRPDSSAEERHAVRGKVKKLRYAVEPAAALYGKPAAALLRTLRRIQDHLGQEHDSHMTQERLRALSRRPIRGVTPAGVFLLGRMAERHAPVNGSARDAHTESRMNRQLRKRWKRLRRTLESVQQTQDA
jgi:CHAD domain-containing protein